MTAHDDRPPSIEHDGFRAWFTVLKLLLPPGTTVEMTVTMSGSENETESYFSVQRIDYKIHNGRPAIVIMSGAADPAFAVYSLHEVICVMLPKESDEEAGIEFFNPITGGHTVITILEDPSEAGGAHQPHRPAPIPARRHFPPRQNS